ncbi:serine/threonine protein kinase [Streptomyces spinoverrucosus]|uniref:non-specific serine/threonine protein kinase n=1 Tax=Streptomyces spinoverrucosus TaxID=284043 RepID=A0A4Y3VR47_9ACTN|nr:serine/threonine-protein kinase [Streptomyces spinoverrucosus]GEC08180.1 serine/threonine protein kinase [Streptomyces spinoverrucosus]GHB62946.1 serine/threonine protein kinase [Streptomyces spinoverrucosus]
MGEVFAGRYELVDPIGRGGVGAVWRAWDHRRRRYVAAKVLQQRDAHSLLRFVREQALRIDHPHVLAPASWAADDDKVLFTMDLVAGGSLAHLVGDYGPLPPSFVCTLLDQLLSGLAAVHAEDVVHRDVKPANVLLEATGTGRPRLRLSDFGIAMRLGEPRLTETNLVVGTPGYLAPEQMMGAEPDFPADLFAVGLVALYLLEGAKPDAKALIQYFAEHGTPGAPKGIPEPLWQVVATLLQPDPVARFRTATGARKALAAAAELLPEPGPDDEQIEIFDQLGPLPSGFGPDGPLTRGAGTREAGSDEASGGGSSGPSLASRVGRDGAVSEASRVGGGGVPPEASRVEGDGALSKAPRVGGNELLPEASPAGGGGMLPDAARLGSGGIPPEDPSAASTGSVAAGPDATDVTPDPRHQPARPPQAANMSDTGSFHLPPPQPTVTTRRSPTEPRRLSDTPQPHKPPISQHHLSPHHPPQPHQPFLATPRPQAPLYPTPPSAQAAPAMPQRADASTASYTAQDPQVPPSPPPISRPPAGQHRRTGRRSTHRPGPPTKAVMPLLLLALVCYAVGFWALTRI